MNLSVWIAGTEYSLDDGTYCWHTGHDGVGMMPIHRLRQRGPMQHGETDLGFRGDPRVISLALLIEATSMSNLWTMRTNLLNLFKARTDPIKLRFTLDNGDTREIQCHYASDMTLGSQDKMGYIQRVGIMLDAHEPAFYNPTGKAVIFALGGGVAAGQTAVPTPVPTGIGESVLDQTVNVVYGGSWLVHPYRIRIVGPITNAKIENLATDEVLDFTGTTIGAGHYYDIDCRYSAKTIVDDGDVNKIADLAEDSDLATWHLEPDPDAVDGINPVQVTGTAVTAATEVYIHYYEQFVGI